MLKKILFILLAVLIAINFGDSIMTALMAAIPPLAGLLANLIPDTAFEFSAHSIPQYVMWAIESLVVWVLLKGVFALISGLVLPGAQRFGTTKILRRIQGILFNAFLFFDFSVVFLVAILMYQFGTVQFFRSLWVGDDAPGIFFRALISAYFDWGPATLWIKPIFFGGTAIVFLLLHKFAKNRAAAIYGPIIRFLQIGRFGMGGSGRFATQVEEWALRWRRRFDRQKWLTLIEERWSSYPAGGMRDGIVQALRKPTNEGLFMGRSLYSRFHHVGLKGEQHMLTVASSRSGKGVCCIIPNLLTFTGSVICVDPKGTNAIVTAARRKAMGQNVYVIDPFNIATKHLGMEQSDGFNPLSMLDPESITIREDIEVITEALVVPSEDVRNASHWDDGAKTIISGLIAHLITKLREPGAGDEKGDMSAFLESLFGKREPGLPDLRTLLTLPPEKQDRLWAEMAVNPAAGGLARDAGMRVVQAAGTEEMQNIMSNVSKHTAWLSGPAMKDILTRTSFNFAEIKERPTTIYLVVPMHYLSRHRRFLRLFINLAMLQMSKGARSPHPVLTIIDEFLALGRMNEISRAVRELAGYNLIVWPFVQDLSGLQELYKNDYRAFISNSRAVQMFAVSVSDQAGMEYATKSIGDRNMSYVFGVNAYRSAELRKPNEISVEISAASNCQYILRDGEPPILLEKVKYFESAGSEGPPFWIAPFVRKLYPFLGLYGKDPDYS